MMLILARTLIMVRCPFKEKLLQMNFLDESLFQMIHYNKCQRIILVYKAKQVRKLFSIILVLKVLEFPGEKNSYTTEQRWEKGLHSEADSRRLIESWVQQKKGIHPPPTHPSIHLSARARVCVYPGHDMHKVLSFCCIMWPVKRLCFVE